MNRKVFGDLILTPTEGEQQLIVVISGAYSYAFLNIDRAKELVAYLEAWLMEQEWQKTADTKGSV